ncbi:MAG: signal recognition particle protein [candidate division Zixibacteria bacterium]|nr:signal recognition particle protein [candidate division Zixibacteria bacterium]
MFEELAGRMETVLRNLRGQGKLTEQNIDESLRQVRRALLEADVNFRVAKDFIDGVKEKALGRGVLKSLTPGQQMIGVVHEELVALMGDQAVGLSFSGTPPTVVMMAGLQGSGKTTASGKLARMLQKQGRRPLLAAADVYRPAAITQLQVVGSQIDVPVFTLGENRDPIAICAGALEQARQQQHDVVILDTAGRLHIDDEMMEELERIQAEVKPHETLLVVDGMTGQDAVNVAETFNRRLKIDGSILTKMDGDARGGAAISIRRVTQRPIKFIGVGEKPDALEPFHPERMVSRILGMGDVVSLVERAQAAIDLEEARRLEEKMRKESFDLEDFRQQLRQVSKLGSMTEILDMIPGVNKNALKEVDMDERALPRMEAILNSMTVEERRKPTLLNGSRRRRIARGSGTTVQEVNQLLKQFDMLQQMMRRFNRLGKLSRMGRRMFKM